jgi:hypothetical protein
MQGQDSDRTKRSASGTSRHFAALRTCDSDEYSGFISALGGVADTGGLAAGSTRSQMTLNGRGRSKKLDAVRSHVLGVGLLGPHAAFVALRGSARSIRLPRPC